MRLMIRSIRRLRMWRRRRFHFHSWLGLWIGWMRMRWWLVIPAYMHAAKVDVTICKPDDKIMDIMRRIDRHPFPSYVSEIMVPFSCRLKVFNLIDFATMHNLHCERLVRTRRACHSSSNVNVDGLSVSFGFEFIRHAFSFIAEADVTIPQLLAGCILCRLGIWSIDWGLPSLAFPVDCIVQLLCIVVLQSVDGERDVSLNLVITVFIFATIVFVSLLVFLDTNLDRTQISVSSQKENE
mmetsp:Transcript_15994/g.25950  ORF Transcript_15994/g.25950 Transcript_15994/m.25950 type:complete len:238 (+) Transcript_15994:1444-2157(+)